ncbi:hypothetical protein [Aquibacillus rhizosphaerae]|uniref:Integral membrane protein n=1 Tax=Aquibacillus rhizosphaerae TaxID=3051431 RepID=A0ABT7L5T4_9BACI|nr:hypothetical protein [Aquibacillus sp. LR5S19]MDL4841226.1 hypothetical protein [Aquibacillus sp. LR5S19]
MVDFILQYKWVFFITGEIVFWLTIIGFLIARYLFNIEKWSKYFIVIWLLSDVGLLFIGILDYRNTGRFDTFQVIITVFLIYAFTFGKKDFKKLDRLIKRKIMQWKGEELEPEGQDEQLYGMKYAIHELKGFGLHIAFFSIITLVLAFFYDLRDLQTLFSSGELISNLIEKGLFDDEVVGRVTGVWTLVLVIDGIITLSYFIFPQKKKR